MTSRRKLATALVATTLFAVSAWYLAERFQWQAAFGHLLRTDFIRLIILVWAIHFAYICVRTWRWSVLVRQVNPQVSLVDLYWITAVSVSLAILTPGQLGEALKIELLSRRGVLGRLPGLGAFALERIMDVVVLAGIGMVGLMFGSRLPESYPSLGIVVGLLTLIGGLALYLLFRAQQGGSLIRWLEQIRDGSGSPTAWLKIGLLSMLGWFLIGLGWQIALYAVDIRLSLTEVMWLLALITYGTLLSLIPGGLGVAEVLTVEVLKNMGVDTIAAQAGALVLRAYGLILILYGVTHLLLLPCFRIFICPRQHDSAN